MKNFNKIIAGMANRESDYTIAKYLNFLASKVPVAEVRNFHIFVAKSLYNHLNKHATNQGDELLKRIENRMDKHVKDFYSAIPKASSQIEMGVPFRVMKRIAKDSGADLIALGKLKNTYGTLAKNVIRYIESNVLIIPEDAKHTLTHILVPVDLSAHSAKILNAALDIQAAAGNQIKITCLHTRKAPNITYYYLDTLGDEFEDEDMAQAEVEFDRFIMKNAGKNIAAIEKVLIREVVTHPSQNIINYVDENDVDFVIMGTKSHTAFDAFLGSTVEKVITKNDKVPLLIIK